jgi:hypothetical protein
LKPIPMKDPRIESETHYQRIYLFNKGKRLAALTHRLIAEAFIPNPLNLPEVNHRNGRKDQNEASNLEWTTHRGNMIHGFSSGLVPPIIHYKGEKCASAKLTLKEVEEIRLLPKQGQASIAKKYGVSRSNIGLIQNRKSWK